MKIKRILAYRVELPLHETTYKWAGGKSVAVFDRDSDDPVHTLLGTDSLDGGSVLAGFEISLFDLFDI